VENVGDPENHVQAVLERVEDEHLRKHYKLYRKDPNAVSSSSRRTELKPMVWADADDFMTKFALASGRLLKGGEPDIKTVAKMVLTDFQRGNLPYYCKPPGCEGDEAEEEMDEEKSELKEEEELVEDVLVV
jgi:nuclear GTP-binding protein